MKKLIIALLSIFILGCQGDNMATIGEEISGELVSTNVTDTTDIFNNTIFQNYPTGSRYSYGDSIYENTGEDIIVALYDAGNTYSVNDIVFKDNLLKKVSSVDAGDYPKQPETYNAVDSDLLTDTWQNRYLKFIERGVDESLFGVSTTLPYNFSTDVTFNNDKTKMFTVDKYSNLIYQYTLTTPGDITSKILDKSVATYSTTTLGICFNSDGTKMYQITYDTQKIYQLSLSSAYDIATLTYDKEISTFAAESMSIQVSEDGFKLITTGKASQVFVSSLGTQDDIGSILSTTTQDPSIPNLVAGKFTPDGLNCYLLDADQYLVRLFTLSSAYDLTSSTLISKVEVGAVNLNGLWIDPTGMEMYTITTNITNQVRKFTMVNANDLEGCRYSTFPATNRTSIISDDGTTSFTYTITEDAGSYRLFSSYENSGGASYGVYTNMNVYTHIDATSIEEKANVDNAGLFAASTLIIRDDGLYIRTSIDSPIETEVLTDTQFVTIVQPVDMVGFSRIQYMNQYRPFDGANNTPAISSSPMVYTIKGMSTFNSFTLSKVLASNIEYKFILPDSDSNYQLWLDGVEVGSGGNGVVKTGNTTIDCMRDANGVLSAYPTTVVFYSDYLMPPDSTVTITLTHTTDISLGDFTLNNSVVDWMTNLDFSHSIQDFNDYTPDAWGNIPQAVKAIVTKYTISMDVYLTNYDHSVSFFESIAGKFVTIDASDSNGRRPNGTSVFGSLIRRVMVTSCSHKSIVKDGELWRLANLSMSVQEVV